MPRFLVLPLLLLTTLIVPLPCASADVVIVPSFLNDVVPVLTRYGCNSGGCHGKLAGQKGFRLSLRGYAPELDFEWISREGRGRRVNPAAPELSLMLKKAVGDVPHGGGRRFDENSDAYRVLSDWIRAGTPGLKAADVRLTKIVVSPQQQSLRVGESKQLQVIAHFSDDSERDVTWLTKFDSNDPGQLSVTADGMVGALRHGENAVRAAFQGLVEIATFTVPLDDAAEPTWYTHRNNVIDDHVMKKLASLRIEPSTLCDDTTFLRRAYIDAIGTTPTPAEVLAFLSDAGNDRRQRAIDRLLDRPEFTDYWTLQLCDLLQNRKERDHDVRGPKGVRAFHAWVRQQVAANRPWDQIAREIMTSSGNSTEQPAIGYFIVTVGEKEAVQSEVTDSVAQAFLGTRIGCARCHNHPLEKYTQDDFYHFAAFFSRVALSRQEAMAGPTTLRIGTRHTLGLEKQIADQQKKLAELQAVPTDKPDVKKPDEKQIAEAMKRLESVQKQLRDNLQSPPRTSQPRTGQSLEPRPLDRSEVVIEPGADPRVAFAAWMTRPDNDLFAGAMVNRVWKHFFGVGMVEPVDDLRATNPPSNPELWRTMLGEFVQYRYDLKHVMRLILNSRTYQSASDTRPSNVHDMRFYSHYYARRLPAEVLLDAICQATGEPETFAGYPRGVRAIQVPDSGADSYFLTLFGRSARVTACACERENDVTLPQLLHLQNGEIGKKIAANDGRLRKLLEREKDNRRVAEELFLATLGRLPTAEEVSLVQVSVPNSPTNAAERLEAFTDVQWALMNAKDFAFNH